MRPACARPSRAIRRSTGGAFSGSRLAPRRSSIVARGSGSGGAASDGKPSWRHGVYRLNSSRAGPVVARTPMGTGQKGSSDRAEQSTRSQNKHLSPSTLEPSRASSVQGRRGRGLAEPASQPVPPLAGSSIDADLPLLVDSREVARLLGIGRTKAFELMARDQVPVVRIGRSVRVLRSALERWVGEQAVRQAVDQGKYRGGGLL